MCILGRDYSGGRDKAYANCKSDELLAFRPNFQRSFGDEFGAAVRGDVAKLGSSYMAIFRLFEYHVLKAILEVLKQIFSHDSKYQIPNVFHWNRSAKLDLF